MKIVDEENSSSLRFCRVPVWYAVGEAVAQGMRQLPRPQLTQAMSEASAAMYEVPRS